MAKTIPITVSREIFELAPDFRRGVISAQGIKNGPSSDALQKLLREEESRVRQSITIEDPRLQAWREAFRTADIKPNKFHPSVDALIRRVLNDGTLPSISTLVDIGTVLSLRHLLPCGAHSLNDVTESLVLRKATGVERFTAFGTDMNESTAPGEFIYVDDNQVATSKWVWRQANHTIIRPETTAFELNVDALAVISDDAFEKAMDDAQGLIASFLNIEPKVFVLSQANPSIEIQLS